MEYHNRLTKAQIVEKLFINYCKEVGLIWAYTGMETLKRNRPKIRDKLIKINTESARNMRFFPDMMVIGKDAGEVDLKYGPFIEKEAYECYIRHSLSGTNIGIVNLIQTFPTWKLIFFSVRKLKFLSLDASYSVRGILMPNDGKWVYPKRLPPDKYREWKEGGGGSGTPYGIIDYKEFIYSILKEYDSWDEINEIIAKDRLNEEKNRRRLVPILD